jgi:hydrogenase-4 component F
MRLIALILVPVLGAVAASGRLTARQRVGCLLGAAVIHLALTMSLWLRPAEPVLGGWLAGDSLGLVVLSLVSVLFFVLAGYAVGYLRVENPRGGRLFVSCLMAFLAAASLVGLSHQMGLMWVGLEATTLSMAPLIFHRHDRRSLEAVWKYLVISSVGIALALLGMFFLATAQVGGQTPGRLMVLEDLVAQGPAMNPAWLKAAFIFLLVGFGTKMGLAPMHTWKPDTYGEAPPLVGALMAGALTSCAFLGIARIVEVTTAAGLGDFIRPLLIGFGLLSLLVAAVFMVAQSDIKRLLAYSSVEHMGLLVLGLGVGGVGAYGTMLHLINNGLAKGLLFLAVGNVVLATGTSHAPRIHGILRSRPVSGMLLVTGLFAVTGSPPFGLFLSEFTILTGAVRGGHPWVAAAMLLLLAVIFIGMATVILEVAYGEPDPALPRERESGWLTGGPLALAVGVLLLGLYIPAALHGSGRDRERIPGDAARGGDGWLAAGLVLRHAGRTRRHPAGCRPGPRHARLAGRHQHGGGHWLRVAHARVSRGPSVRAGDRRAMRRGAEGTSLAQAAPASSTGSSPSRARSCRGGSRGLSVLPDSWRGGP